MEVIKTLVTTLIEPLIPLIYFSYLRLLFWISTQPWTPCLSLTLLTNCVSCCPFFDDKKKKNFKNIWQVLPRLMVAIECESGTAGCSSVCYPASRVTPPRHSFHLPPRSLFYLAVDTSVHLSNRHYTLIQRPYYTETGGNTLSVCVKAVAGAEGGKQ